MRINEILQQQGWEPVERQAWIAVLDHRPEFRAAFATSRVGKIVGTSFYVTLQRPEMIQDLIRELGCAPVSIKSTSGTSDAVYWGFDTKDVSEVVLKTFATKLAGAVNSLI